MPPNTNPPQEVKTQENPFSAVKVKELTPQNEKKDDTPPLLDIKVTNPIKYLKALIKKILANEGIKIYVRVRPLTVFLIIIAFASVFTGTGFSIARIFFPNSSPILGREVSLTGKVEQSDSGEYYLMVDGGAAYKLYKLENGDRYKEKQVLVKGKLGKEANSVTVVEVLSFN